MNTNTKSALRGNAWLNSNPNNFSAFSAYFRYRDDTNYGNPHRGFRCVYPVNNDQSTNRYHMKGASCDSIYSIYTTAYFCLWDNPNNRYFDLGFRCVYPIEKET